MAIVTQYHKDTNTTYVYESISYWDAEKGQSRSKRKVIGKLDPVTGEIVPTGKRGRKSKSDSTEASASSEDLVRLQETISTLQKEKTSLDEQLAALRRENTSLLKKNQQLEDSLNRISSICSASTR